MQRRQIKIALVGLGLILLAGCGGAETNSNDTGETDGGSTSTRELTGSVPASDMSALSAIHEGGAAGDCAADTVIATDSSGGTVSADVDADCAFSIELTIGRSYVISLAHEDNFVATLIFDSGTALKGEALMVGAGSGVIALGSITITGNTAIPEQEPAEQMDYDDDGVFDFEDEDDDDDGVEDDLEEDCDLDGFVDDVDEEVLDCEDEEDGEDEADVSTTASEECEAKYSFADGMVAVSEPSYEGDDLEEGCEIVHLSFEFCDDTPEEVYDPISDLDLPILIPEDSYIVYAETAGGDAFLSINDDACEGEEMDEEETGEDTEEDEAEMASVLEVKPRHDPHPELGEDRVDLDREIKARIDCVVDLNTVDEDSFRIEHDGDALSCNYAVNTHHNGRHSTIECEDHEGMHPDSLYTALIAGVACEDGREVEVTAWAWLTETEDEDEGHWEDFLDELLDEDEEDEEDEEGEFDDE